LSQSDPADEALATIASILDQPEGRRGSDRSPAPEQAAPSAKQPDGPTGPADVDGYTKTGPGPMEAIRFKWTVRRRDDGNYEVEERIGESSVPVLSGPMSAEAAVKWVDERESEAQQRFERLKGEMAARTDAAELIQLGGGEL
jgi:hypothetical protein